MLRGFSSRWTQIHGQNFEIRKILDGESNLTEVEKFWKSSIIITFSDSSIQ